MKRSSHGASSYAYSSFSSLRPIVIKLARVGSSHPIECIVSIFCAVTLVYFKLLEGVRNSDFLVPDTPSSSSSAGTSALQPAIAFSPTTGLWSAYPASAPAPSDAREIWMRQIVMEIPRDLEQREQIKRVTDRNVERAMQGLDCYKAREGEPCWMVQTQPTLNLTARSLGFSSRAASKEFSDTFAKSDPSTASIEVVRVRNSQAANRVKYASLFGKSHPDLEGEHDDAVFAEARMRSKEAMKSGKWMIFAVRAFVLRFWGLAKRADSADIFVMLIAYLLMHSTFVSLFLNMRRLTLSLKPMSRSSGFWLAFSALVSSCLGFLFALLTAVYLGIHVNPILLGEALPFLVITVGFEKPFILTRAVFSNPNIAPSGAYSSSRGSRTPQDGGELISPNNGRTTARGPNGSSNGFQAHRIGLRFAPPVPSREIVLTAVSKTGVAIIRDYAIEVAVLVVGAMSGVAGLREFCHLAALILLFDALCLMTFYVAVLTIMVEVHRIKIMRHFQRTDSSADLAKLLDDPTAMADEEAVTSDEEDDAALTWKEKIVKLTTGTAPGKKMTANSPTARLKLLLIACFLVLHALNLVSTLTMKAAKDRHTDHSPFSPITPQVDTASALHSSALSQLIASHPPNTPLVVHVAPALQYRVLDPNASPNASPSSYGYTDGLETSSFASIDRFMSRWTKLVGDPIFSKWIVIALGISVFLNGYLLKGIATGSDSGFAPGSAAEAAARILLASTGSLVDEEDSDGNRSMRRSMSEKLEGLQDIQKWTTEDAAAMTRYHEQKAAEAAVEAHRSVPSVIKVRTTTDSSDDEDSPPPSPIFVRTKKLGKAPKSTSSKSASSASANAAGDVTPVPSLAISSEPQREIRLSPSTVALVPQGNVPDTPRDLDACVKIFNGGAGALLLNDEEIILLVQKGKVAAYALEKVLKDYERSVFIRRALISRASARGTLETSDLPYQNFDYSRVMGQCCENVVGYMPLPVGIAGPLRIDGMVVPIPMATVEGALVASTSRGCKALNVSGGVTTVVTQDAMTRGPALAFPSVTMCATAKRWIDGEEGSQILKAAFNSTSRFARLQSLKTTMAGRTLYVRFATQTGDAMGMNMISKGTERALDLMASEYFPEMQIAALSGNYCTDKKPAAINWIEGRGKSVVAEGIIPGETVKSILKTTVKDIVRVNITKNLVGSAMAGTMGGNNAHAANILSAIFLATGQDVAQNVESSNCITLMEAINDDQDLLITCSMPSIEVGTVGGGTILLPQGAMLDLLGVRGPHPTSPGENAQRLARIICAAVMAGELSLMAALTTGSLVKSHLSLNRSVPGTPALQSPTSSRPTTPAPHGRAPILTPSTPIHPIGTAPSISSALASAAPITNGKA